MKPLQKTQRTKFTRKPSRACYDRAALHAILNEANVCHVGLVVDGMPRVLPMIYARIDDTLYLHGASKGRWSPQASMQLCVTVTLVDGLVLARSGFNSSMNYRCAVLYGEARWVDDVDEKERSLRAMVDHALPGRSEQVRGHTDNELKATSVLAITIEEASVKTREGGPEDDVDDVINATCWAGIIPFTQQAGAPQVAPDVPASAPVPVYARPRNLP